MNGSAYVGVVVGFAAMVLASSPVQAKRPEPPQVIGRSSVTMPAYGCQSAAKWMRHIHFPGTRVDEASVTAVRKQGYTFPVSDAAVCGYMGSGTYTVTTKVWWSASTWRSKHVPVYRYREVRRPTGETTPTEWETRDYPFTCALDGPATQNTEYRGGVIIAFYNCSSSDEAPINFGWDDCCTVNLPSSDWTYQGRYYGQLLLAPTRNNIPFSDVPQSVTGTGKGTVAVGGGDPIYESVRERYVHHYRKKRVLRWVKQRPVIATHVVQVTVR